jgi:hypothetical protein
MSALLSNSIGFEYFSGSGSTLCPNDYPLSLGVPSNLLMISTSNDVPGSTDSNRITVVCSLCSDLALIDMLWKCSGLKFCVLMTKLSGSVFSVLDPINVTGP